MQLDKAAAAGAAAKSCRPPCGAGHRLLHHRSPDAVLLRAFPGDGRAGAGDALAQEPARPHPRRQRLPLRVAGAVPPMKAQGSGPEICRGADVAGGASDTDSAGRHLSRQRCGLITTDLGFTFHQPAGLCRRFFFRAHPNVCAGVRSHGAGKGLGFAGGPESVACAHITCQTLYWGTCQAAAAAAALNSCSLF